jgi:GxxExxY protein
MKIELASCGLVTEVEKPVVIRYHGCEIGRHRLDMVVEDAVILELKVVEQLGKSHYAQVRSYLKATDFRLALLVSFASERADFRRIEPPAIVSSHISTIPEVSANANNLPIPHIAVT